MHTHHRLRAELIWSARPPWAARHRWRKISQSTLGALGEVACRIQRSIRPVMPIRSWSWGAGAGAGGGHYLSRNFI